MVDTEGVQEQLLLGRTLGHALPELDPQQGAAALPVAGAATRALKWLGDETVKLLDKAQGDDGDGFLETFADVCRRTRALEPVVQQLRPRWEAAAQNAADVPDGSLSAGHVGLYQRCRQVVFTAWAAACPKKLRAAASLSNGSLVDLDVAPLKAHWPTVREALAAMEPFDPAAFHSRLESELRTITGAPTYTAVAKPKPDEIPREHLSRAIGKAEAAKLHCGATVPDPAEYFRDLVAREIIKPPIVSGRSLQFDVRDFPASKRDQMR